MMVLHGFSAAADLKKHFEVWEQAKESYLVEIINKGMALNIPGKI